MFLIVLACMVVSHQPVDAHNYVTKDGTNCFIPFNYEGIEYRRCTEKSAPGTPWCYTNEAGSEWGYCAGEVEPLKAIATKEGSAGGANCFFPFTYASVEYYNECSTKDSPDAPWCYADATSSTWGYCVIVEPPQEVIADEPIAPPPVPSLPACNSNPCLNDGECVDVMTEGEEPTYRCQCLAAFDGSNCEKSFDYESQPMIILKDGEVQENVLKNGAAVSTSFYEGLLENTEVQLIRGTTNNVGKVYTARCPTDSMIVSCRCFYNGKDLCQSVEFGHGDRTCSTFAYHRGVEVIAFCVKRSQVEALIKVRRVWRGTLGLTRNDTMLAKCETGEKLLTCGVRTGGFNHNPKLRVVGEDGCQLTDCAAGCNLLSLACYKPVDYESQPMIILNDGEVQENVLKNGAAVSTSFYQGLLENTEVQLIRGTTNNVGKVYNAQCPTDSMIVSCRCFYNGKDLCQSVEFGHGDRTCSTFAYHGGVEVIAFCVKRSQVEASIKLRRVWRGNLKLTAKDPMLAKCETGEKLLTCGVRTGHSNPNPKLRVVGEDGCQLTDCTGGCNLLSLACYKPGGE